MEESSDEDDGSSAYEGNVNALPQPNRLFANRGGFCLGSKCHTGTDNTSEGNASPSETTRRRKSTGADDLSMFFRGALIQKKRLLQDIVQELSDGQRNLGCSASRGSNC